MFRLTKIIAISLLFSSAAFADDDDWGYRPHHHHHHEYYPNYGGGVVYAPAPVVQYVPAPVVEYVPVQPYYAPPPAPVYYGYDRRSPQGLVGGMLGSMMGYEFSGGDPVATGLGAATGAWMGNGGW